MRLKINVNDIVPVLIKESFECMMMKDIRFFKRFEDEVLGVILATSKSEEESSNSFDICALNCVWDETKENWGVSPTQRGLPFFVTAKFSTEIVNKRLGTCN